MRYADEEQTFSPSVEARRRKYASDLDGFTEAHEELLRRVQVYARKLSAAENSNTKLTRDVSRLKTELSASRAEVDRLSTALKGLRTSKSLRIGKAVLSPARRAKRAADYIQALRLAPSNRAVAEGHGAATQPNDSTKTSVNTEVKGIEKARQKQAELLKTLEGKPSAANVMAAVSHSYFVLGDIREPARLIKEYQSTLSSVDARQKRTIAAVLGQERLWDKNPVAPPRQPNPAYLPERGRVMYCAHSTGKYNSNGYSTRTAELTNGLQREGMDVIVVARPGYPWDVSTDAPNPAPHRFTESIRAVDHIFNPGPSWTSQPLDEYWIEATDIYIREAQRMRVESIHSASNHVTALPALTAARILGVPFTYEVRGLWEVTEASKKEDWENSERYKLAHRLETHVAKSADTVLAITEEVKEELVKRGVERDRIRLLPNGVDTDRFAPMPPATQVRDRLGIAIDVPVVGYAGSLVHYEGLTDLLKALAILREGNTKFHAVIVGDGPERDNLEKQTALLGLRESVSFVGRVEASAVPNYISIFDVMPCPRISLQVTELVSPLKPLEAMAAGKAMVLSDLSPLRAMAGVGQQRALLSRPSDPADLARSLRLLLEDDTLRQEIGNRARIWTVKKRQWSQIAREAARAHASTPYGAPTEVYSASSLKQIKLGIIADTFTVEGLRPEVDLCELRPSTWKDQISEKPLDAVFVESAWEGPRGEWRQKVGYYDEERFRDLKELIEFCNFNNIPTIFWNKEDPVHFNRFQETAKLFDHVFTTDAACISRYVTSRGPRTKSFSSSPFYAQPVLHNPLPTKYPYSATAAYAGSYYGDRYPERSAELDMLLDAASSTGLTIYDRQHLNPDSPYTFPARLRPYVRGGLSYLDMVQAYKAHPVHLNVNSVAGSPTMFSRRVVEVAACGTAVLSGRGAGVDHVLNGLVPTVTSQQEAELWIERWMEHEEERIADVWLSYRTVHRAHTAAHRLTLMLRIAGLAVQAPKPPRYAVRIPHVTPDRIRCLENQTVRPTLVVVDSVSDLPESAMDFITGDVTDEQLAGMGIEWIATEAAPAWERTKYEDLLTACTFGSWSHIGETHENSEDSERAFVKLEEKVSDQSALISTHRRNAHRSTGIVFRKPRLPVDYRNQDAHQGTTDRQYKNVLVAGHDLKFARGIIDALRELGHDVEVDHWAGHNQHDEDKSRRLLAWADIVFCEWTLGNAVWYSRHLAKRQRLVTRFHSQELFTQYPVRLEMTKVSEMIFVGPHVLDVAVRDQAIPREKAVLIPNAVDADTLSLEKEDSARFHLGLVGIVPAQKHLDRALDTLAALRSFDERYQLHIKGKRPEEYSWMAERPGEMAYYEEQYRRILEDDLLRGAVHFHGHGDDMPEWYRNIGVVLSVSDFESFHLTLADGAASGALVASLPWPGADRIYPASWISASLEEMASYILQKTSSAETWRQEGDKAKQWARLNCDSTVVLGRIVNSIVGASKQ